jgi:hypothetical protein
MSRVDAAFLALVAAQALHSSEEFNGRLYEVFAPALFWVALELLNGLGHAWWSFSEFRYTPGVAIATLLLGIAAYVVFHLPDLRTPGPSR